MIIAGISAMTAAIVIATVIMIAATAMNMAIAAIGAMTATVTGTAIMTGAATGAAIMVPAAISAHVAGASDSTGISAVSRPWSRSAFVPTGMAIPMSSAAHAGWCAISTAISGATTAIEADRHSSRAKFDLIFDFNPFQRPLEQAIYTGLPGGRMARLEIGGTGTHR